MTWNWEHPDWPEFVFDAKALDAMKPVFSKLTLPLKRHRRSREDRGGVHTHTSAKSQRSHIETVSLQPKALVPRSA